MFPLCFFRRIYALHTAYAGCVHGVMCTYVDLFCDGDGDVRYANYTIHLTLYTRTTI